MGKFERKIALVTGAGGGIGSAICHRLASEGASVLVVDINDERAISVVKQIRNKGYQAYPIQADISNEEQIEKLPHISIEVFGSIPDIVVCNAGIQTFQKLDDLDVETWDKVFNVNVRGTFLTMQTFSLLMQKSSKKGAIITISSIQARTGSVYYSNYSASKAAVLSLTKSFALNLATKGIRVNSVAPGIIETELWEKADCEMAKIRGLKFGEPKKERIAQVPLKRAGTPDDVAKAVSYLASEDADYITGECIHVAGGDVLL